MLPRVSAALAQFIAPIATSAKQGLSQQGFERFVQPGQGKKKEQSQQNPQQDPQQKPPEQAKVIPFPSKEGASAQPPAPSASIPSGISQALLQLLNLFQEQRTTIMRWIGTGSYQQAARQQKKNGRIRKGTILDEKAE